MFKFTKKEVIDLIISFLVISLGFCILYSRENLDINGIITLLPIIMIGVGCGFIFHELGHKISAMHYGYWAEYKLWVHGLIIALITSFFGFIFAAPGAVYIYGPNMTDKENGIISLCGPIINIAITLIFIGILFLIGDQMYIVDGSLYISNSYATLGLICIIGAKINSFLALFNLLPLPTLDGSKLLNWSIPIWFITIAVAAILVYYTMFGMFI